MKLLGLEKTDKKIINRLIDILAIGIIIVISFWNISKCDRIIIVDDEFGYWGVAAHIVGMDWSDMMSITQYYSFGQSIILSPILLLNKLGAPMSFIYKMALACNGIMLAGSYTILHKSAKKLISDELNNGLVIRSISFFVVLSICNSTKILQTWPEISCFFVFCLIVYEMISFFEEQSPLKVLVIFAFSFVLLSLHMRTVGVYISVILILLLFLWNNRETVGKKNVVLTILLGVFFAFVFVAVKTYFSKNVYLTQNSSNDMSTMVSIAGGIFSLYGIIDYFFSVLGKVFYSSCETFGLCVLGWIYSIYVLFWSKDKLKKNDGRGYIFGFALLTSVSEILICSVKQYSHYLQMNGVSTISDSFFYGRYHAFAITLSVIIGCIALIELSTMTERKMSFSRIIAVALMFMIIVAWGNQFWVNTVTKDMPGSSYSIRWTASPWFSMVDISGMKFSQALIYVFAISMFVFLILLIAGTMNNPYAFSMVFIIMGIALGIAGAKDGVDYVTAKSNNKQLTVERTFDILDADSSQNIYCVCDESYKANTDMKILQWRLGDRPIKFCYFDELDNTNKECSVYLSDPEEFKVSKMLEANYECLFASDTILLWVSPNNENYDIIQKCGEKASKFVLAEQVNINLSTIVTEASYTKINNCLYQNWDYSDCYLTEGMNTILDEGTYEFDINMDISDAQMVGEIGFVETGIVDGENVNKQGKYYLNKNIIENEKGTDIKVSVVMEEPGEPYIGFFTYGNSIIKINSITYSKVAN